MLKSSRYVVAVLAAMAMGPGSLDAQKNLPALDAEIETTFTTPAGRHSSAGHYYRSQDGKMREDSPIGSMITDIRSGTVTFLNPSTKEARVIVIAGQPRPSATKAANAYVPFEEATIEGQAVTKARAVRMGGQTQELWTAKDLGLVVFSKVDSPGFTMTRVLRKVSLREPDPAVFEVPKDYKVMQESVRPTRPGAFRVPPRVPSRPPPAPRQ